MDRAVLIDLKCLEMPGFWEVQEFVRQHYFAGRKLYYYTDLSDAEASQRLESHGLKHCFVGSIPKPLVVLEARDSSSGQSDLRLISTDETRGFLPWPDLPEGHFPQDPDPSVLTWNVPGLGRFLFDALAWNLSCLMPAFSTRWAGKNGAPGASTKLRVQAIDPSDMPKAAIADRLIEVVANQVEVAERVASALIDSINGTGPDSGMWWHGDPISVLDHLGIDSSKRSRLSVISDRELQQLIFTPCINVEKEWPWATWDECEEFRLTVCFEAEFDREHGVGVLLDGIEVVGIGHANDVGRFRN